MTVELIPVVDITAYNQNIPSPQGPYWENEEAWNIYRQICLQQAGYSPMPSFRKGMDLFRLTDVPLENLRKYVLNHTKELLAGKYDRDSACPLYGGYILTINAEPKLYPQCCSDLSDIFYWNELADGITNTYCEGHPAPQIYIEGDWLTLALETDVYDPFVPPHPDKQIHLSRTVLKIAVQRAYEQLLELVTQLQKINQEENLHIPEIEKLLVYGNR